MRALRRLLLPLLFLFSGASGLVFEVVWLRMLIRAFGVTVYAVSTVLAVFMGGLAIGSYLAGKRLGRRPNLLADYGTVELFIGATAMASTGLISLFPALVRAIGPFVGEGVLMTAVRLLASSLVLLPPTILMGATLPILAGWVARERERTGRDVGLLYALNTLGAVLGTGLTGFVLLMILGELRTVLAAACTNVLVGILARVLARGADERPTFAPPAGGALAPPAGPPPEAVTLARRMAWTYGISGFAALGYQVLWSRMSTLVLGSSIYAFSAILVAYLLGLSLGSFISSRLVERVSRPLLAFGVLQLVIAALAVTSLHVFVAIGRSQGGEDPTYSQLWSAADFPRLGLHALLIVLPVTIPLGALFPLVMRLSAGGAVLAQETVGRIGAANTVGAIAGSFAVGFLLIPALGTLLTFLLLAAVTFALGLYAFRLAVAAREVASLRAPGLVALLAFVGLLSVSFEDPFLQILVPRLMPGETAERHIEDKSATVTAVRSPPTAARPDWRHLFINGIVVSSTGHETGALMIDMPLAFHPAPKKTLLVGLGVGEAFRASLAGGHDTTAVDLLEPVVELFPYFQDDASRWLSDPKAHIVIADGRNHLLASPERYDLVFVDGTPPVYSSGTVNLYAREFVELVRDSLTEDGIFALWFPTSCFERDFWMVVRSFVEIFPHYAIWAAPKMTGLIILGTRQLQPLQSTPREVLEARVAERGISERSRLVSVDTILGGLLLEEADIREKALTYPRLTDDRPHTELPLGAFLANEPYYRTNEFVIRFAEEARNR